MAYYSRNHYRRLSNGQPDTPETIAARKRWIEVGKQVEAEMNARFAPLDTVEKVLAADAWRRQREAELLAR